MRTLSLYGTANAGVRARVQSFVQRLQISHQLVSYFESNAAGTRQFLRSPVDALRSELQLRQLLRSPSQRLLLSREASPLSKGIVEEKLLKFAPHGVYDIDDALHLDVRSRAFEAFFSKSHKAARAASAADVVIVGNAYLADWASTLNREVFIIPTCVDPAAYRRKIDYDIGARPRLLWLGTATGEKYLAQIAPALVRLRHETGATLTIIGDPVPRLGHLERMITRVPWSLDTVHQTIADYDIGLMPLSDNFYERGKCAYKLLEYGAAALPAVASPIGVNERILREAKCRTPESTYDWYEALRATMNASPSERFRLAERLREVVVDEFSFARWLPEWCTAMNLPVPPAPILGRPGEKGTYRRF